MSKCGRLSNNRKVRNGTAGSLRAHALRAVGQFPWLEARSAGVLRNTPKASRQPLGGAM